MNGVFWQDEFQFLIGKVKTEASVDAIREDILFQFLIGKVKTRLLWKVPGSGRRFQFLIGKVKTGFVQVSWL